MFGWFRPRAECPVDDLTREWADTCWDWLEGQFGRERLLRARVILPRPEFFPDPFHGTDEDARRMLDRVCGYMDLAPATIELALYDKRKPAEEGHHRRLPAGAGQPEFRVWVERKLVHDPLALVAAMAHELAEVHLVGHGRISENAEGHEALADLLTVYLGMGVFGANAVIREAYWTVAEQGGWRIERRGHLGMPAFGYAFALFARNREEDGTAWARELRLDVRTAFEQAMRFLAAGDEPAGG